MEQKGKRTHGHGPQCGDYRVGEGGIRGINGNGRKTIKNKLRAKPEIETSQQPGGKNCLEATTPTLSSELIPHTGVPTAPSPKLTSLHIKNTHEMLDILQVF